MFQEFVVLAVPIGLGLAFLQFQISLGSAKAVWLAVQDQDRLVQRSTLGRKALAAPPNASKACEMTIDYPHHNLCRFLI